MLKSKKHVFWEALFITVVIFLAGIFLGMILESNRIQEISEFYTESEISLFDIYVFNGLIESGITDCGIIAEKNINFADRIYNEASLLEKYSESEKLSDATKIAHKRYDLMRTLLWINALEAEKVCEDSPTSVIYLYELETEDLAQKATQNVWSKILMDLKEQKGEDIILIPISVDNEIASLQTLLENYEIQKYPVVIIRDEIITQLESVEELDEYFE